MDTAHAYVVAVRKSTRIPMYLILPGTQKTIWAPTLCRLDSTVCVDTASISHTIDCRLLAIGIAFV